MYLFIRYNVVGAGLLGNTTVEAASGKGAAAARGSSHTARLARPRSTETCAALSSVARFKAISNENPSAFSRSPRAEDLSRDALPEALCDHDSTVLARLPRARACSTPLSRFVSRRSLRSTGIPPATHTYARFGTVRRARLALLAQLRLRATRVQTVARTHLVQLRVDRLLQSALVLQSISLTRILRNQLEGVRWACLTIQSWWRGDRTRRVIREEKLKMLTRCTAMSAQAYEDAQCTALLRAARGKSRSPGLQLIHVDVSVEPRTVYPHGWVEGLLNLSRPQAPEPIAQVTCGAFHTVVLTRTGHLYGYGLNDKSQLGLSQDRAQPPGLAFPERIAIRRPIQRVTCGADHTLALTVDGTVYAWGDNTRSGSSTLSSLCPSERKISGCVIVRAALHMYLLRYRGQCGTRAATSIVSIPHQVRFHKRSEPVTYVSAGYFHSAALVGGELWVWGRHDHLHLASLYNDIRTPLRVADTPSCIIAEVGSLCRVECGLACTFLLNDYGELFVFGHPKSTTLGIGSNSDHRRDAYKLKEPQQVVDFRVGTNFVVAVTSNGDVWQWGTFLEWDPCIAQATKVTYLDPVPVPAGALGDERAEECGVGWWEVVIRCRSGRLLGWSIWKHAAERDSKHSFSPHVYQFNLTKNKHVKHVQVASCPSLTAVLCEMTGKGETAGKKEYAFAS